MKDKENKYLNYHREKFLNLLNEIKLQLNNQREMACLKTENTIMQVIIITQINLKNVELTTEYYEF